MNQKQKKIKKESKRFKKSLNLTIAIPTLNSENTLHITMNSILNQDLNNFRLKIVLIDSGSEDKTKELFFSYGDKLDLVFKNIGKCSIGEARNYAIKNITTDYFIFLDSDDALIADRLSSDFKILNKFSNLNFIYGDSIQLNTKSFDKSYYCIASEIPSKYQFLNIPFNLSSVTVSRRFLLANKISFKEGIRGRLGEDWRFINQINCYENFLYSPRIRVIINSRGDSHTQDSLKCDLHISKMEFICELFNKIKKHKSYFKNIDLCLQIQSSLFITFFNIIKYSKLHKINKLVKILNQILSSYKKISYLKILINLILFPASIYLILLIHRRSIYSPQRKNIAYSSYKLYSSLLYF